MYMILGLSGNVAQWCVCVCVVYIPLSPGSPLHRCELWPLNPVIISVIYSGSKVTTHKASTQRESLGTRLVYNSSSFWFSLSVYIHCILIFLVATLVLFTCRRVVPIITPVKLFSFGLMNSSTFSKSPVLPRPFSVPLLTALRNSSSSNREI